MLTKTVNSLSELKDLVHQESSRKVIILFMASIDPETGKSWCPDCREAEPVVHEVIESIPGDNDLFVTVYVGQKTEWKSPDNEFRGEPYHIKCVPTLLVNGRERERLEEGQLLDRDAIKKLIEG